MVEIKAFKGLTYNKEKIDDLNKVMSPPYDIIPKQLQEALYDKDPHNFVRLILGKQFSDDTDSNNRYTRAKQMYNQWIQENILSQSDTPALFPYKITYTLGGKQKTMNGFFTLLKLDPQYKLVKAHERTLSKPKADRLNLMRATHSNLEPIQLLYIDEDDTIRKHIDSNLDAPMISVTGYDGFTHELWKLTDPDVLDKVTDGLRDEIVFIADGHHRYQTAINYAEEMKEKSGDNSTDASFNYRMVILVNMFDEGLEILPTHRLIKLPDITRAQLLSQLEKYFTIEQHKVQHIENTDAFGHQLVESIQTDSNHKFIMFFKDTYYVLTLKDVSVMDDLAADRSETWRTLDVSILHKIILETIMGINEDTLEDHVKYTREDGEAISKITDEEFDLSFLMNPTKIEELKAIADGGEHMPQKSTYFLPKMLSGLVMYKM